MPTFAAVDIGSNAVRLKIARLQAGRLRPLHEDREVTRLGEGVFSSGFLTPESMAETVRVLRRFHRSTQQIVTDAVRVVLEMGKASTSTLQRRLRLGYGRAARILDMMQREGIIGPPDGSKPREVLKRPDWLEEVENQLR